MNITNIWDTIDKDNNDNRTIRITENTTDDWLSNIIFKINIFQLYSLK